MVPSWREAVQFGLLERDLPRKHSFYLAPILLNLPMFFTLMGFASLSLYVSQQIDKGESVSDIHYVDVGTRSGLIAPTVMGKETEKPFILESTGGGIAIFDYNNNGWLDIFQVNGWRREGFDEGEEPSNRLYRNNKDGTFTDVTRESGLWRTGWGQGVCVGDIDNDGWPDLFVTYYGRNVLYRNQGDGRFRDVTDESGLLQRQERWNTGCAFVDYDGDGFLDLFVANYVAYEDALRELPDADDVCKWKGMRVFCGPRGLRGSTSFLYRNLGNGRFVDVSESTGISMAPPSYSFTPLTADFDNDGWPDIYVANDTAQNFLFHNQGDGTFREIGLESFTGYNFAGVLQAGMGVATADYNGDGWLDIVKTNFSSDVPTLYRNLGHNLFADDVLGSGLEKNVHFLGWGVGFPDVDNDGWPDIFIVNGHVYPNIEQVELGGGYKQRKLLYRNLGNGRFEDISFGAGPGIQNATHARGLAIGDVFNQGKVDFVINNLHGPPSLLHNVKPSSGNWILVALEGTKTNPLGIGSRVRVFAEGRSQFNEVRSGGSFCSQDDLRLRFGLGSVKKVDRLEVHWLGGDLESLSNLPANHLVIVRQGEGVIKQIPFPATVIGF